MSRIGLSLLVSTLFVTGCGVSNVAVQSPGTSTLGPLQGRVQGGQQPVAGAHVYLYQVGSTGNGGKDIAASTGNASVSLLSSTGGNVLSDGTNYYVTTDVRGGFSITGDYTCTSGTQLYLYAIGGNPGAGTNSHASFMAGLGACPTGGTTLPSTAFFQMNEVTTIAMAYAMAGYASDPTHISANFTLTGNPQAAVAATGMLNAMANVTNLVDLPSGNALAVTPGGNGIVPQAELNTLGNILASCVNSSDIAPGGCTALFSNTLSDGSTGTAPADTASAAINLAHNAATNVATLFALQSGVSPFSPDLSTPPTDFSVSIAFGGGGASFPRSIAADASGNIWGVSQSSIVNAYSPLGVPFAANGLATLTKTALSTVTLDNNGNAWAQDTSGNYTEFSPAGTQINTSAISGGTTGTAGGTSDSFGYLWSANTSNGLVYRFDPIAGTVALNASVAQASLIAADSAGNVWLGTSSGSLYKLNQLGTTLATFPALYTNGTVITVDPSNAVYVDDASKALIDRVGPDGTISSFSDGVGGGYALAVDGNGTVWSASNMIAAHTSTGVVASGSGFYLPTGVKTISIAIDPSGNLWAADTTESNGQLGAHYTEFIGLAAPTVTPLSYAATHGTLQNALNLTIGFNGVATQFPYETQFYNAQAAYYSSIGQTYPAGARYCHAYMSWDAGLQPVGSGPVGTEGSRAWFENWLAAGQGSCDRALVTFKTMSGITSTTNPPAPADYLAAVTAFVNTSWGYTGWTGTIDYTAWNEPQGSGSTGNGLSVVLPAESSADYYLALRSVCAPPGCLVAAGDFGSNGNHGVDFVQNCTNDAVTPCSGASYMDQYKYWILTDASQFGFTASFRPEIWSYHGWDDINNYINSASHCTDPKKCTIRALLTALTDGSWSNSQIWDTEVAAGQNPESNPTTTVQACAASFLVDLTASMSPRFTRLYWTQLFFSTGTYFSMFNADGSIKPSFTIMTDRDIAYTPPAGSTCP